jgi:NAD(P)-dependent dehydrogenase (short-subunit alcohol dehydrogenase family)
MTDNPPLADRVAVVTGSTSGIGREIARGLAAAGATVVVHGRDREKGQRAIDDIAAETGNDDLHCYTADLTDVEAVRAFAADVLETFDRIDVLVNNAGTWQRDRHLVDLPGCAEGVESTFAVNHLGHFLLTHCLVDHLAAGSVPAGGGGDETDDGSGSSNDGSDDAGDGAADPDETDDASADPARVVVVSSAVHRRGDLDLEAARGPDGPSGMEAYALSKLANVMFTYELARRLPDGVTANCCHPGTVPATSLDRDGGLLARSGWKLMGVLGKIVDITNSPDDAARTPLYLATSPEVAGTTGAYFEDRHRKRSAEASYDRNAQRDLWATSEEWVGLDDDERLST